jgi:hypothetical protein
MRETGNALQLAPAKGSGPRSWRRLDLARGLLVLLLIGLLGLWFASLPQYYARVTSRSVQTYKQAGETVVSNEMIAGEATSRGLSLPANALYEIARNGVLAVTLFGVAGLLLWRGRDRWFSWFTALILICIGANSMAGAVYVALPPRGVLMAFDFLTWHAWPLFFPWLFLFSGRGVAPRWTIVPVATLAGFFLFLTTPAFLARWGHVPEAFNQLHPALGQPGALFMLGLIAYSQFYRYRHTYSLMERQQIKWFLFGVVVLLADAAAFVIVVRVDGTSPAMFVRDLAGLATIVIPVSIGIAILRYRLFDVDFVIRRTLVYAILTALLVLVYLGGVLLLQTLFTALTGQGSPVALVVSTLAIAALFGPLRRHIQAVIDRRFYRRKYDAANTLTAFGSRLRDETDLEMLSGHLLQVVEDTMQPQNVSLWLKRSRQAR